MKHSTTAKVNEDTEVSFYHDTSCCKPTGMIRINIYNIYRGNQAGIDLDKNGVIELKKSIDKIINELS